MTKVHRVGLLLVLAGIIVPMTAARGAEPARKLSIRAVMHRQYTVSNSPFERIKKDAKSDEPDWSRMDEASVKFTALAESPGGNEPKWGETGSWKTFTSKHLSDAKALGEAVEARRDRARPPLDRPDHSCRPFGSLVVQNRRIFLRRCHA